MYRSVLDSVRDLVDRGPGDFHTPLVTPPGTCDQALGLALAGFPPQGKKPSWLVSCLLCSQPCQLELLAAACSVY